MTPTILLTGFGSFPGVAVNASGLLVTRVARAARRRFPNSTITTLVLPTEWQRGPQRVKAAIARAQPDIAIHFGVSSEARGFVIERRGVNACAAMPDGAGHLPALALLEPDGPPQRSSTLPVATIVKRLTARGLPAVASSDAGTYLCNAVLFQSLALASADRLGMIAGFIHIPASLAGGGIDGRGPAPGCPLTLTDALTGGLEIIAACLE
jgi:pyroglutamyl-peptidase